MKLKELIEMVVQQDPSIGSEIEYNVSKELKDLANAVDKYQQSQIKQFENTFKNKMLDKVVEIDGKQFNVKNLEIKRSSSGGYVVEYLTNEDKRFVTSKPVTILNDVDGPVTNATQMTSQPSDSPHKIKQF